MEQLCYQLCDKTRRFFCHDSKLVIFSVFVFGFCHVIQRLGLVEAFAHPNAGYHILRTCNFASRWAGLECLMGAAEIDGLDLRPKRRMVGLDALYFAINLKCSSYLSSCLDCLDIGMMLPLQALTHRHLKESRL